MSPIGLRYFIDLCCCTSPVTLLSIVTNLIHSIVDTEHQRLWIGLAHQILELFIRKADVSTSDFFSGLLVGNLIRDRVGRARKGNPV